MFNRKKFLAIWKDPVMSKVIATGIICGISAVGILISKIQITNLKNFITSDITLPLWLMLILCISVVYSITQISYKLYISRTKVKTENPKKIICYERPKIETVILDNGPKQIKNDFLKFDSGSFNIWVNVTDYHNKIHPERKNLYIVGYATNNGVSLKNPKLATYPNAWAIRRITATESDNYGTWQFWCNCMNLGVTHLSLKEPISGGLHLFTIAWSKSNNYIIFLIDSKVVAEGQYENWPSDFSGKMMIGTWSNSVSVHNFGSKLGPVYIINSEFDKNMINEILKEKP